ncbi:MAG: patatin-like phospholipase family protein [Nitrospira sp.]|nr:patatin-like phospholipase family protein [Nitrospira sp.]MDH4251893.1 patatin-like phospholipase family protein [Nitrospira sp.]MDH4344064.1 patatin-like phospholipase family protein [Nitrospira sp.]
MPPLGAGLLIGCAMLLVGCEYVRPTMNAPLAQWDAGYGYRSTNLPPSKTGSSDGLFIVASFSGGGARASALAYGVLQEMARTPIVWEGRQKRLVDELNIVNAVSGGSFPATYYALYGDRIFQDFEVRFLRKNWESELRSRIFRSPSNWLRLWSPYFGRAHIFAELLDEALFDGHTFGDLVARHQRPLINLHASDMASLSRFEFNQRQFDVICSDLSQLPLSVAAASTSALPLLLSPISMTNYAGQCGFQPPARLVEERPTAWGRQRANELRSYLDAKKRPYIHLLDGGLSDNVGMRSVLETTALVGDLESTFQMLGAKNIRKLVYLMVSAETAPDLNQYTLNEIPGLSRVSRALIDIPINRYSMDTMQLMHRAIQQWRVQLRQRPEGVPNLFAPDADIYLINASLTEVTDPEEEARLMNIATNLALTDEEVDHLLLAGSHLLRNDPEFQRLIRDLGNEALTTPMPSVTSQTP